MQTYQELYALERRRADMCEGQILELRRRIVALETENKELSREVKYWERRTVEEIEKLNKTKLQLRELRKIKANEKTD